MTDVAQLVREMFDIESQARSARLVDTEGQPMGPFKERYLAVRSELKQATASSPAEDVADEDEEFRQLARKDGIEVDADAVVSRGTDDGAYVQAWVWVYKAGR